MNRERVLGLQLTMTEVRLADLYNFYIDESTLPQLLMDYINSLIEERHNKIMENIKEQLKTSREKSYLKILH